MKPFWQDPFVDLYLGDARQILAELPEESVHCVVTPPIKGEYAEENNQFVAQV